MNNTVGYFEIQVDDLEKARDFYSVLFDWKFTKDSSLPIEYYRIEGAGPYGGLLKRPASKPSAQSGTNAYVCSIEVADFDKTMRAIISNGGQVALPKFAVVGKCWQGYFLDTEGNTFGLFQVDESAK